MKTVIVTPDTVGPVANGGIGTFVYNFARLLRAHQHDVSVMFTREAEAAPESWRHLYDDHGIGFIHVPPRRDGLHGLGYEWFVRDSIAVSKAMPDDVDVVYFQEWLANGFHYLRRRRFLSGKQPVCVTVLHSNSAWIRSGMQRFPLGYPDASLDFAEAYTAQHTDFVLAPSQHMIDWVRGYGWQLPPDERVRVMGYPFEHPYPLSDDVQHAPHFKRVIFFGRLETRKGLEVFVGAMQKLYADAKNHPALAHLEEVVLLGKRGTGAHMTPEQAKAGLAAHVPVRILENYDQPSALRFLAENRADSLVVMPSRVDNLPFAVIEAATMPGLNFITSDTGGIREIMGEGGAHQLTPPHVRTLAPMLAAWFAHGPRPASQLGTYDTDAANARWLAFHKEALALAEAPPTAADGPVSVGDPVRADVCVPYYNLPQYLPHLLDSLANQTVSNFSVTVVNDGSTSDEAVRAFEHMKAQYEPRGWRFLSKENGGVGHTRNLAAAQGSAENIIFMDADNVAAPNMVERFLAAVDTSGADCLTAYMSAFSSEGPPYRLEDGKVVMNTEVKYVYTPIGNSPLVGIFTNTWGDANMIVRRAAFEAVGGFREDRFTSFEDYELLAVLSLAGYEIDVIPEYLFFYRFLEEGFSRVTNQYDNQMRVLRAYQERLHGTGLEHLPEVVFGLSRVELGGGGQFLQVNDDADWVSRYVPHRIARHALLVKLVDGMMNPEGQLIQSDVAMSAYTQAHTLAHKTRYSTLFGGLWRKLTKRGR